MFQLSVGPRHSIGIYDQFPSHLADRRKLIADPEGQFRRRSYLLDKAGGKPERRRTGGTGKSCVRTLIHHTSWWRVKGFTVSVARTARDQPQAALDKIAVFGGDRTRSNAAVFTSRPT